MTNLRTALAAAVLTLGIAAPAAASSAPEGIRWNHRSPAYDCNVKYPHPPAGTICSHGVWVHPVYAFIPW